MSTTSIYSHPESSLFTLNEICERCRLKAEIIIEMVEYGIVTPIEMQTNNEQWQFSITALERLGRAQRLRHDLELNLPGLALSLELLDQVDALQKEINSLKHQLHNLHRH